MSDTGQQMAPCLICGAEMPPRNRADSLRKYCGVRCRRVAEDRRIAEILLTDPEYLLNQQRRYRAKYASKLKERTRARRIAHLDRELLNSARQRAKTKGIPFGLTLADIKIPDTCPVLGVPIFRVTNSSTPGPADNSPTLDRIVPSVGYMPGNVRVISWRANRLKSDATMQESVLLAIYAASDGMRDVAPIDVTAIADMQAKSRSMEGA